MEKIGIIGGTGYVGLVTAVGLAILGHQVVAADINKEKVRVLQEGKTPIFENGLQPLLEKAISEGRLSFTTDISQTIRDNDILFVAVGTPLGGNGEADLSQVIKVAETLSANLSNYKIIVVKSTVPIGTFDIFSGLLKKRGKREDKDYALVFNPEFLREGEAVYDFFHPTRVVVGAQNEAVAKKVANLFIDIEAPFIFTNINSAQMIKYGSNAFLAARISFVNELANICERVGADIKVVAEGMGFDSRIGKGYLNAGIGFGGPCLGKDLNALIKMAENVSYDSKFFKAVIEKNHDQVKSILKKISLAVDGFLLYKKIGVLGLSFKAGTNDVRTSLGMKVVAELLDEGAQINAYDPQGMEEAAPLMPNVKMCDSPYEAVSDCDAVVVLTPWPEFVKLDWDRIKTEMKGSYVVDAVNILEPFGMKESGFQYVGVGRGQDKSL
ncbi:UDP-glucose/GDP-mannose dehydrogenase family protein [Paradesulfitobacterium aromaticivorans]